MEKLKAVISILMLSTMIYADEISDSINEALTKYNGGDLTEASNSLNYAITLISQKKGDALSGIFPKALDGWEAEEVNSSQIFGGGISADRQYNKGESSISISMASDSPMLQATMMLFSNPMFATADGAKMETINGQKAIVKYKPEDKNGDVQIVVGNRFLVTVNGNSVSKEEMIEYVKSIDFAKLLETK
ncbi:MAG: hypothetical protein ACD_79C00268G0002 [uncultured bacterium]|nr:MAG: hypothetical protein ACD_79C00268G0002 [uncultured bacterium]